MKKNLLLVFLCLNLYQAFSISSGCVRAENAAPDTLCWQWEVSSTTSTRTKTCTFEFTDNLLVNWGDGVTEWIPDSMSAKTITHVYATQANFSCSATGVGISYFKADSRRILSLDATRAPALTYLSCTSNQLASLDVSRNALLVSLYCGSNNLKKLDVSRNQKLQTLTCSDNQLTELDCSGMPVLKKITCHTNPLGKIRLTPTGGLSYLSCSGCSLTAENLDSLFLELPTLAAVSTSKNLYVLNNPGSSSCRLEIAAARNWTLDRVITQSSFYIPSVSCRASDSMQVNICLKNMAPAIAFEMDVLVPEGFRLDTLRSRLASRKGQHALSIARMSASSQLYKIMSYSMKSKDAFSGTDGAVLNLFLKAPPEIRTYTLDIQKAMLLDTLTNKLDLSVTDGQLIVGATSLAGDANGDASVDVTDVVNLVAFINGRHPAGVDSLAVDIDGNGLWDISDVTKLVVIINSAGAPIRSAPTEPEPLTLYRSDMAPKGNNLYIRQSAENPSRLEICLDNVEEVQAFQADLFLPEGLSIAEEQEVQPTERNAGQTLQIGKLPANRYRLISYALKTDAAFHGKTGVLASLQLEGVDQLADGTYPVRMQQAVLTGMDLSTVRSQPWDAELVAGPSFGVNRSIVFGTEPGAGLWARGAALMQVEVWDFSGRRIVHQNLNGSDVFRTNLSAGNYIVRAQSATLPETCQKVTVK